MSQRRKANRAFRAGWMFKGDWYLSRSIRRWLDRLKTH